MFFVLLAQNLYIARAATLDDGAAVIAQTKDAIAQSNQFFTVRGKFKTIAKIFEEYDTSFAIAGAAVVMLAATSVVTQTGRDCWQAVGSNVVSMFRWFYNDGQFVAVPLLILLIGAAAFVVMNNYTASAYCWAGINVFESAINQLKVDDFYTHEIPSNRIRSYILINFNSIVDAVNNYRAVAKSIKCAQAWITIALNSSKKEELSRQCRIFLDLIRKVEEILEAKLQVLYQEMGEDYQKQLEQQRQEQMRAKLERRMNQAVADGEVKYNINEHVVVK